MIHSLKLRLAVGAFLAIGISLLMVWMSLSRLFTDYVEDSYENQMTVLSDGLAAAVTIVDGKLVLADRPVDPRLQLPAGGRYWQLVVDGQQPERSRSLWDTVIDPAKFEDLLGSRFHRAIGPDGLPILVTVQKSVLGEGKDARPFTIYAAFSKAEYDLALTGFHAELRRMLMITGLVLAAAALLQAAIGLQPLARLRTKVAEVRAGKLPDLGTEGPREVRPLVREINLLLEERETAIARARSRASDLAHGLKTPLTVLSQLAARLDPLSADMALKQVEIIRQRADRQLQAARLGVEQMATADLGALVGKLVHVLRPVTEDRDIAWTVELGDDLSVGADPADLAEAIGNVLDNAAKWARSAIAVDVRHMGDHVIVTIGDDGPGIAVGERAVVLGRGVHAQGEFGGSGLGLAITSDIALAYGASLDLGQSALGGLEVRMSFPVAPTRQPKHSPS